MVAVLTGCSGTQPPMASPSAVDPPRKTKQSQTFVLTYAEQTFVVPTGVTRVTITASGASGGASAYESGVSGLGGWVRATIPVTPGESLAVFVGGQGYRSYSSSSGLGGFNGGGASNCYDTVSDCSVGGGGGGASDVRQGGDGLQNRVVAGGGGGEGCCKDSQGGTGGGLKGAAGQAGGYDGGGGGGGGTKSSGGVGGNTGGGSRLLCGGTGGQSGTLGEGGDGGIFCNNGGGGGGGYYGGGGGGGSSYVEKRATHVRNTRGTAAPGNGQVIIAWH
jgi:hypothetical protein